MQTIPIVRTVNKYGAVSQYAVVGGMYIYFGNTKEILKLCCNNHLSRGGAGMFGRELSLSNKLGDLNKHHFLRYTRKDLVAEHVGRTLPKPFHYRYK